MKICHICGQKGEKSSTYVDRTGNPNRPIVFTRHNCVNKKCAHYGQYIGDELIQCKGKG